jgi:hypothetical protein
VQSAGILFLLSTPYPNPKSLISIKSQSDGPGRIPLYFSLSFFPPPPFLLLFPPSLHSLPLLTLSRTLTQSAHSFLSAMDPAEASLFFSLSSFPSLSSFSFPLSLACLLFSHYTHYHSLTFHLSFTPHNLVTAPWTRPKPRSSSRSKRRAGSCTCSR